MTVVVVVAAIVGVASDVSVEEVVEGGFVEVRENES